MGAPDQYLPEIIKECKPYLRHCQKSKLYGLELLFCAVKSEGPGLGVLLQQGWGVLEPRLPGTRAEVVSGAVRALDRLDKVRRGT